MYKGDCLEVMEFLIRKGVKVDAIITDPPYAVTHHSWDRVIPFPDMWEKLNALIKDDGAIILFGNEPFSSNLRISNPKMYRYDWKWIKTQGTGFQSVKTQPLRCYEDIMVFSKSGISPNSKQKMCYYPQGIIKVNTKVRINSIDYLCDNKKNEKSYRVKEFANYPKNILQIPRENKLFHPTQKPIKLMEYLISTYTKEQELVLDFTSGSGSTLLACEILNRKWIGIEIMEKYCQTIKKRIENGIQLKFQLDFKNEEE